MDEPELFGFPHVMQVTRKEPFLKLVYHIIMIHANRPALTFQMTHAQLYVSLKNSFYASLEIIYLYLESGKLIKYSLYPAELVSFSMRAR